MIGVRRFTTLTIFGGGGGAGILATNKKETFNLIFN